MSTPLPHDNIIPFKGSEKTKKEQVADFDLVAGRYDKMPLSQEKVGGSATFASS